jgi:hypothetical protein
VVLHAYYKRYALWAYSFMIIVVKVLQVCHVALKRDFEYINTVQEGSEDTHAQVIVYNFMLITH